MCFSAEASFIGATALTIIGAATLKNVGNKDKLWAALPILFAFQQFCEGVVWLEMDGTIPHSPLTVLTKDLYLFFALAFWVMWIPLAFSVAEPQPTRKWILRTLFACGIVVAYFNLDAFSIFQSTPSIKGRSLEYQTETLSYKKLLFLAIVALPPFISSLKYMSIFGVLVILSYAIADYYYLSTFTSVWCFFGGFVSLVLYFISFAHLRFSKTKTAP
jgi:hypothetical protein